MTDMSQTNSDLTSVDRAILRQLLRYGGANGRELASAVDVPARAIGSRLVSLTKRGLLKGERYAGMTTWELTFAGIREAERRRDAKR